jgi:F-type H+-transporting ATPase subunit delta
VKLEAAIRACAHGIAEGAGDKLDNMIERLTALADRIEKPEVRKLLAHPEVAPSEKIAAVRELTGPGLAPGVQRVLDFAAGKGFAVHLRDVLAELRRIRDRKEKILQVRVDSAQPLTNQERDRLTKAIAAAYRGTPEMTVRVRPELLAGMLVRIGTDVIDNTVSNRLRRLGETLSSAV